MGGIYIHIPFCASHCTYCGFYSELLPKQGSERVCHRHGGRLDEYVDALCTEIRTSDGFRSEPCTADTLYIGGGTPSLLSATQLEKIVLTLQERFQPDFREFTVEVNPDDIILGGKDYALGLRSIGVTRVSMGIQSFNDRTLRRMGRRHNSEQSAQAYRILMDSGFDNISVDIIFGFDTEWDIEEVKTGLAALSGDTSDDGFPCLPRHISCYQLSVEEGSGLEKMISRGLFSMPDDETCAAQYSALCRMLAGLGYEHYEVSNWAMPGFRSRHNSSYWNHSPYLGFGPAAHSLIRKDSGGEPVFIRRWNNQDAATYVRAMQRIAEENPCQSGLAQILSEIRGYETLTPEQVKEEKVMLGLRTGEGIEPSLVSLTNPVSAHLEKTNPADPDGRLRIPENKWFISDSIIADLI